MTNPNIVAMRNWQPKRYQALKSSDHPAAENELLDVPGKVWTVSFFMLAVFFVISYWVIVSLVDKAGLTGVAELMAKARPSLSVAILAMVTVIARRLSMGMGPLRLVGPQWWLLVSMFVLMVISSALAGDQVVFSLGYTFDVIIKLVMLYILAMSCINSARGVRALLWVAVIASLVPALGSIVLYKVDPQSFEGGVLRAVYVGHYSDPNRLAGCLAFLIPAMVYLFASTRSVVARILLVFTGIVALAAILMTGSRGGLLALAAGIVMILYLSRHRMAGVFLAGLLFLVAAAMLPAGLMTRYGEMKEATSASTAITRLEIWKAGARMVVSHPILGVGTGCYETAAGRRFMPSNVTDGGARFRAAHSSFVKVLGENGVPAFLLLVGLYYITFRDLFRLRRSASRRWGRDSPVATMSTALLAILASVTVASMTIDYTDDIFPYLFMGTAAALKHVGYSLGLTTLR